MLLQYYLTLETTGGYASFLIGTIELPSWFMLYTSILDIYWTNGAM
jgi:hypothetical protein